MPTSVSSSNVSALRESATIAVSARVRALAAAGRSIINLGAGEPDFDTPAHIRAAAQRAIEDGHTRYTAVEGLLELRTAIAEDASSEARGARVAPDEVMVTTGTKQALFNACFALFGPGDEVLVPTPAWTSYYEMIALARATAVPVCGSIDHSLKATADDLRRAATSRTRGLLLNSPCNPTGAVYSPAELAEILALARREGWWVISDEIYRAIAYDAPASSMLHVADGLDRLVVVDGVAKSFAMTGWRIGWAIAPRSAVATMTALQSHTTSNASTPSQHAVLAALTDHEASPRAVREMVTAFRARRDAAAERLDAAGVAYIRPQGAFYFFVHIGAARPDDPEPGTRFAQTLLDDGSVAVVPGVAFRAPEWIRVSYAAPHSAVLEGVDRLVACLRR